MIPTEEQFIELNSALNQSIEFIKTRLDYSGSNSAIRTVLSQPTFQKLSEVLAEDKLQQFIKPDVELYLEQSEASQQLFAWKWLHSQQNFIHAKGRIFNNWPSEEHTSNGLEKHIARYAINFYAMSMKEREQILSNGVINDLKTHEGWMANREPLEILHSGLALAAKRTVLYRKWIAGIALALSNYHYGKTAEIAVDRRRRVEALISAWENFCEQIALAQSDAQIGEYLFPSNLRLRNDRRLAALRALHQNGTLYFIGRADETVSERLFIRELALLHNKLFHKPPNTSVISDMFHLEGMKSAPTERAIQRIAKSAISNWREIGRVESEIWRELHRQ